MEYRFIYIEQRKIKYPFFNREISYHAVRSCAKYRRISILKGLTFPCCTFRITFGSLSIVSFLLLKILFSFCLKKIQHERIINMHEFLCQFYVKMLSKKKSLFTYPKNIYSNLIFFKQPIMTYYLDIYYTAISNIVVISITFLLYFTCNSYLLPIKKSFFFVT